MAMQQVATQAHLTFCVCPKIGYAKWHLRINQCVPAAHGALK